MGKSSGHSKKKAITGTQQKVLKQGAREYQNTADLRQQGGRSVQSQLTGTDPISQQLMSQFAPGGQAYSPEAYKNSFQNAQLAYQPLQNVAREQFQQQTIPDILSAYGSGSKMSSSLQQALAQAAKSLGTHVSGQIGQLAQQDVQNQQQLQYNTLQSQYAGQQNAANQASQYGLPGAQMNLAKDKYYLQEKGPSAIQKGAPIAGAIIGGVASGGNPAGIIAGYQGGQALSQAL